MYGFIKFLIDLEYLQMYSNQVSSFLPKSVAHFKKHATLFGNRGGNTFVPEPSCSLSVQFDMNPTCMIFILAANYEIGLINKQECIPVGCVLPAH